MDQSNNIPFISTPFTQPNDNTPKMPQTPITPPQTQMQSPNLPTTPSQMENMESLYPEIYQELYPAVLSAVNSLLQAGYTLTPELISSVVDNIIRNSGLWYEDEDNEYSDMESETIPTQVGFGRSPYRRNRRKHHNRNSLRDIIRILLLRELFSRGNNYPYLWR